MSASTPSGFSSFLVPNTTASNNGGPGILVEPADFVVVVTGVLSKVTANNNGGGIEVDGLRGPGRFSPAAVMLRNVVASNNRGAGLGAGVLATLRVAHSVVTGNGTEVETLSGGKIFSYGDNDIDGNTNDNTGVLTPLAKH
jgi:hypothetical protein